jgi:hypothetical protein
MLSNMPRWHGRVIHRRAGHVGEGQTVYAAVVLLTFATLSGCGYLT